MFNRSFFFCRQDDKSLLLIELINNFKFESKIAIKLRHMLTFLEKTYVFKTDKNTA